MNLSLLREECLDSLLGHLKANGWSWSIETITVATCEIRRFSDHHHRYLSPQGAARYAMRRQGGGGLKLARNRKRNMICVLCQKVELA